jgi:hypothetical protein
MYVHLIEYKEVYMFLYVVNSIAVAEGWLSCMYPGIVSSINKLQAD